MSITNGYTTLSELKSVLTIADSDDDGQLEVNITAASRMIDGWCNRRFFLDGATSARTYLTPGYWAPALIDLRGKMWHDFDPATVPTVKSDDDGDGVYETTWTVNTDYLLEPLNHAEMEAEPQNQIRLLGTRFLTVPVFGRPQLQVTAKWGWPSVPVAITQACQLIAKDLFKSKDAFGNASGQPATGVYTVSDNPFVANLLANYRLPKGIA